MYNLCAFTVYTQLLSLYYTVWIIQIFNDLDDVENRKFFHLCTSALICIDFEIRHPQRVYTHVCY